MLLDVVTAVNDWMWSIGLLIILCGTGIYFTIRLKFIQVRKFGEGLRLVFGHFRMNGEKREHGEMTPFQSLATAIAAQVGTGNLTGAATALVSGGPGAIFWMWLSAFFGMATIYGEAVLAQEYKTTVEGEVTGGPVYYIRQAFKGTFGRVLAVIFAVFIILALGFMGNMVQSNSIGAAFAEVFAARNINVPPVAIGILLAVFAVFIFVGGTKRLAAVVEKMVPIMAAVYIVGSLVLIGMNITALPGALKMIFVGAFAPKAILGGAAGITVREAIRSRAGSDGHDQRIYRHLRGAEPDGVYDSDLRRDGHREGRNRPDPGSLCQQFRRLWRYFRGGLPAFLRLLHDPGLAFLRRDQCAVSLWKEGLQGLLRDCGRLHHCGFHAEGGSGLGAG